MATNNWVNVNNTFLPSFLNEIRRFTAPTENSNENDMPVNIFLESTEQYVKI